MSRLAHIRSKLLQLGTQAFLALAVAILTFGPVVTAHAQSFDDRFQGRGASPSQLVNQTFNNVISVPQYTQTTWSEFITPSQPGAQSEQSPLELWSQVMTPSASETTPTSAETGTPAASGSTPTTQPGPGRPATTQAQTTGTGTNDCSFSRWDICLSYLVYYPTVGLGSMLAFSGAYIFNTATKLSLDSGAYSLKLIADGWTIIRNIANMAFLFILVYIAYTIMLRAETAGTVRMLVAVIVVALLVNFSFFVTRVVVDAGNILSLQFYNAALQAGGQGNTDLTSSIMNATQVQRLLSGESLNFYTAQQQASGEGLGKWSNLIFVSFIYICLGIMLWLLFAMFLTAGIKFLFRIVILWLVIIFAPLAFIARILPQSQKYYSMWQGALISHSLYPAAFLLIFFIQTQLAMAIGGSDLLNLAARPTGLGAATAASWESVAKMAGDIAIRLVLILGMFYIGLRASNMVGIIGSQYADKATNWMRGNLVGGARLGGRGAARVAGLGAGLAYQQSVGRGAAKVAEGLKNSRVGNSWLGFRGQKLANAISNTKVGGSNSYAGFRTSRDKELSERAANLSAIAEKDSQKIKAEAEKQAATAKATISSTARATNAQGTTAAANPNQPFRSQPTPGGTSAPAATTAPSSPTSGMSAAMGEKILKVQKRMKDMIGEVSGRVDTAKERIAEVGAKVAEGREEMGRMRSPINTSISEAQYETFKEAKKALRDYRELRAKEGSAAPAGNAPATPSAPTPPIPQPATPHTQPEIKAA